MRFWIIILAWLAFSINSLAQTIVQHPNLTDDKGLRQGKWTLLFNGDWKTILDPALALYYRIIEFSDDNPTSTVRDYYRSGQVKWEGILLRDKPEEVYDGLCTWYRADGSIEIKKTFANGKQLKETYYNLDGSEISESWKEINLKSRVAYGEGNYTLAVSLFQQARVQAEKEFGKENANYATSVNNLASIYNTLGEFKKAEELYFEARDVRERVFGKEHSAYAFSLNGLAMVYENLELYQKAELLYVESKNIIERKFGKDSNYGIPLNNLAGLYSKLGFYEKAEALYIESKEIQEKTVGKAHVNYALALNNLAGVYESMSLYYKAEPLYILSKDIFEKVLGKDHPKSTVLLNNLAYLYYNMGLFEKAEPMFIEALAARARVLGKENRDYAESLNQLGMLYGATGQYEKAEPLYIESRNIRMRMFGEKSTPYAMSLNNLAMLYQRMELYRKAETLYLESKSITAEILGKEHRDFALCLNNMAYLYTEMGLYEKAESLYVEAKEIKEVSLGKLSPDYAITANNLAVLYHVMGKYEKALPLYRESNDAVLQQVRQSFPSLSEAERKLFYDNIKVTLEAFNSFSFTAPTGTSSALPEVYNIQLATKALLFNTNEKVRQRILSSKNDSLVQLYTRWQEKRKALASAYQLSIKERAARNIDVTALEDEINKKEKQLSQQSEVFSALTDNKQYSWQDIQSKLKKNEAAIEIIRFRKTGVYSIVTDSSDRNLPVYAIRGLTDTVYYAALIVTRASAFPHAIVLKDGNALEGKYLKNYKNSIQFKLEDTVSYAKFWMPIGMMLKKNKINRIYLSPDGIYHAINVSTLQNPNTGEYVMDEVSIAHVTNTKDLITRKREREKRRINHASLFGYPDYPGQDSSLHDGQRSISPLISKLQRAFEGGKITPLPGTKIEVQTIHKLLVKNQIAASEYLEGSATEEEIRKLTDPKVLHIATHGFFLEDANTEKEQTFAGFETRKFNENPLLRSGLLLTGSQRTLDGYRDSVEEDGVLTAYEVINLNLDQTELVVLSACETGVGEIRNGEGVYGLQRAFHTAGVEAVLMSLWKVDDQATQDLMISFYRHWMKYGDKQQAFRKAQSLIRSKYKHPYYWGAFVLVGE